MTSGVACHHRLWETYTVELRRAWHDITSFRQHTRSNDVVRGMPSSPLGSTHGRTTLDVACQHRLKAAPTVERHRALHDITAFGQHTRSNDVGRDMQLPPLDNTHGRTASGVAFHRRPLMAYTVERRRAWNAIISFGQYARSTSSGMACYHGPWTPHTIERSRSSHAIIALERKTRLNDVGCGMPSSPLD